jgi:serine/threonine protein kinase/outer membrane protein assembly factor BamB
VKPEAHEMFSVGDKLDSGHYTVIKELGQGGMGVVFHCHVQRDVAIKMLLPELMQNQGNVEVFHQEARLAAQLEHPNIVTVFGIGKEERKNKTRHYIAMEYLPGGTLSNRIAKELSIEHSLNWMKQLANGLSFAHKKGVVHQDIKSDNIFITMEGDLKIGDFGLARLAQGRMKSNTRRGMGTPAYMSPELCRGEPQDHRSDIYSMGVLFYEMVTAELPYKARGMIEMAMKHSSAPVPSVRKTNPLVPEVLDKVIQRMMAKTPEERYQAMSEVLTILDDLIFELRVARLGLGARARANFKGLNLPSEGSNFFAAPGNSSNQFFTAPSARAGGSHTDEHPVIDEPEHEIWTRPDAMKPGARSAGAPNMPSFTPPPAEPYVSAAPPLETEPPGFNPRVSLRGDKVKEPEVAPPVEIEKRSTVSLLWEVNTDAPIGWSSSPVLNRNEKMVFVACGDGRVRAYGTARGDRMWQFEAEGPLLSSPVPYADQLLVASADGCIYCISGDDGRRVWTFKAPSAFVSTPNLTGDVLYAATMGGALLAVDAVTGTLRWQYQIDDAIVSPPQTSGKLVFFTSRNRKCYALAATNGALKWSYNSDAAMSAGPVVSVDRVFIGSESGAFSALDSETGREIWIYQTDKPLVSRGVIVFTSVIFAGQDRWLYCCEKYDGRLMWKAALRGRVVADLVTHNGKVYATTREGYIQSFNAQNGEQRWQIKTHKRFESAPLLSADKLFVGSVEGELMAYGVY